MHELRAAQRREFIRARLALPLGYTAVTQQEFRRLKRCREQAGLKPCWPEGELPQIMPGAETDGLIGLLKVINDKLDYLLLRFTEQGKRKHARTAQTLDVSGGGLSFTAPGLVECGQHLDMTITLPVWPEVAIDLLGVVRKVDPPRPEEQEGSYIIGVEFEGMSEVDRDRLVRYIFHKQREMLRRRLQPA
jgi:c-di-GMP-binding flagellar brake protein YcgR